MIPSISAFKKLKPVKERHPDEAEKCLKVLLILTGTAETNRIKAELLQQLTKGRQKLCPSWNR
jgi:hypothetical protein